MEKIVFQTREGDTYRLPIELVASMKTIQEMLEITNTDDCQSKSEESKPIVLQKITSQTFQYLIHWAMHNDLGNKPEGVGNFNAEEFRCKKVLNKEDNEMTKDDIQVITLSSIVPDSQKLTKELANLSNWHKEFFGAMHLFELYQVMAAADYLNMELLLHQSTVYLANLIHGKTTKEFCKFFDIKTDFNSKERREMDENKPHWEK